MRRIGRQVGKADRDRHPFEVLKTKLTPRSGAERLAMAPQSSKIAESAGNSGEVCSAASLDYAFVVASTCVACGSCGEDTKEVLKLP